MSNTHDVNLDDIRIDAATDMMIDPELSMECMQATISYYVTLSRIIDRKFSHARKAIQKRVAEMEADQSHHNPPSFSARKAIVIDASHKDHAGVVPIHKVKKYKKLEGALQQLNEVLNLAQLSVAELEQINEIFGLLPDKIKVYYEQMVRVDKELIDMIREISSEDYQAAYQRAQKIIDLVQDGKDVLAGKEAPEGRTIDYSVKDMLRPIETELINMGGKRDGYSVTADGKLVRDL